MVYPPASPGDGSEVEEELASSCAWEDFLDQQECETEAHYAQLAAEQAAAAFRELQQEADAERARSFLAQEVDEFSTSQEKKSGKVHINDYPGIEKVPKKYDAVSVSSSSPRIVAATAALPKASQPSATATALTLSYNQSVSLIKLIRHIKKAPVSLTHAADYLRVPKEAVKRHADSNERFFLTSEDGFTLKIDAKPSKKQQETAKHQHKKAKKSKKFAWTLEETVRARQKYEAGFKQRWYLFCDDHGAGVYDPYRHTKDFIMEFMSRDKAGRGVGSMQAPASASDTGVRVAMRVQIPSSEVRIAAHISES